MVSLSQRIVRMQQERPWLWASVTAVSWGALMFVGSFFSMPELAAAPRILIAAIFTLLMTVLLGLLLPRVRKRRSQ